MPRPQPKLWPYADSPRPQVKPCEHPGCGAAGEYRAPRSREQLNSYYWFCLDHVRAYNAKWNYLDGYNIDQVEDFIRQSTTWERPTWPMGGWRKAEEKIRAKLHSHFRDSAEAEANFAKYGQPLEKPLDPVIKAALALLDLEPGIEFRQIRERYLALVKKLHPDANGGNAEAEEKLKKINLAWQQLKKQFAQKTSN